MDNRTFFNKLLTSASVSGFEQSAAELTEQQFKQITANVTRDTFNNVFMNLGEKGPVVFCAAHIDEIGLMVTKIHDDGFVSFTRVGGVDRRILPAQEVWVHGTECLYGIVGAKPPHVLSAEERKKSIGMDDLYIDLGLDAETVRRKVRIGDTVTFHAPPVSLLSSRMASKSLDDRMGVMVMLEAVKHLELDSIKCRPVFCATSQEEIGSLGAQVGSYRVMPDIAVAIDVTHGKFKDSPKHGTFELKSIPVGVGPMCDRRLLELLKKAASSADVELSYVVSGSYTGTDADNLQIVGPGIPCAVLGVPVKYMHTTVETIDYKTVKRAGRLLAEFLMMIDENWRIAG